MGETDAHVLIPGAIDARRGFCPRHLDVHVDGAEGGRGHGGVRAGGAGVGPWLGEDRLRPAAGPVGCQAIFSDFFCWGGEESARGLRVFLFFWLGKGVRLKRLLPEFLDFKLFRRPNLSGKQKVWTGSLQVPSSFQWVSVRPKKQDGKGQLKSIGQESQFSHRRFLKETLRH